ncbi:sigma-54-dependent Fis family transcriptional regulator [Ideonella margarita]|uniref:Sigma-54-dependent Fis family transcriptional regulator n=1 Tax=Ideonella margarita TaxID=2984191 RepID=A0ABU9CC70_9BURK
MVMQHATRPNMPVANLRRARQQLNSAGAVSAELIGPVLARSWQRCADAGLLPNGRSQGVPHASAPQLQRALVQQRELLSHAEPVMAFLHEQTRDSGSMVVLANADGMLLHATGDADFLQRAERVALRPGATWQERWRGTNAIGTALAEDIPMVVHGGEHYLERNGFLTCAAAPIHDSAGRLLGALDLSGDHRGYHRHTLGLVRSAVRMIEHRLFDTRHGAGLRLRLHSHREGLNSVTEGLLALSADGWITGANEAALQMLQLRWADVGAVQVSQVLEVGIDRIWDLARQPGATPPCVAALRGGPLWLRAEPGYQSITVQVPQRMGHAEDARVPGQRVGEAPLMAHAAEPAAVHADALSALDTGDAAMRQALQRARRVVDKPIALLLLGESGVGKEVFARALHASGPRSTQAFVAVNCAALPESLIEAELFGYRPGAFTGAHRDGAPGRIREADGGTLFLDEIGDMPLAMQGRLLRVLQERQVVPLGGGKPVSVDIQLMCATHRPLRDDMRNGRFREDLYYRINGMALSLPALRDRDDLGALIDRLLREVLAVPAAEAVPGLSPDVLRCMAAYAWPGNLRQLSNALRTACALMEPHDRQIDWCHLPDDLVEDLREVQARAEAAQQPQAGAAPAHTERPADGMNAVMARAVQQAMAACDGNVSGAARMLGISRNTLYRRLKGAAASGDPST